MKNFIVELNGVPTTEDFWIEYNDSVIVEAETPKQAIIEAVEDNNTGVLLDVSNHAKNNMEPIYMDGESGDHVQVGYILKTSTEVEFDYYDFRKKYVDVWATVKEVTETTF